MIHWGYTDENIEKLDYRHTDLSDPQVSRDMVVNGTFIYMHNIDLTCLIGLLI